MSLLESGSRTDPLAAFDLPSLLEGAARLRPEGAAIADDSGAASTFADLHGRCGRLAQELHSLGLRPRESVLVIAVPRISSVLALLAALRAGLDVAVAPVALSAEEVAGFAARTRAVAVLAGGDYDGIPVVELGMRAAMSSPSVRLVGALEGGSDGVVDLSEPSASSPLPRLEEPARVFTHVPGGAVRHSQRTLVAAGLDFVSRTPLSEAQALVTTIAPATFAGLVGGPVVALLSGHSLHLHGPFRARKLVETLSRHAPSHLVVPREIAPILGESHLFDSGLVEAVTLLNRAGGEDTSFAVETRCARIFDFTAFGELTAIQEARDASGNAVPPASVPHEIELEGETLIAVRRCPHVGPVTFEGEAVTRL